MGRARQGSQAIRCAWFNVDTTSHRFRAYGLLWDVTDGADTVAVQVFVGANPPGGFFLAAQSARVAGTDLVQAAALLACEPGWRYEVEVRWNWNDGAGRGSIFTARIPHRLLVSGPS